MRTLCTLLLSITLIALNPIATYAQEQPADPPPQDQAEDQQQLSEADIDTLVAPIALYPDPLISQILPAATYPDDIQAAADWLAQNPDNPNGIDAQGWDLSVKALAHYPQVIQKMAGDMDWTLALGQAYTVQQEEVLQSIQRLRELAEKAGTLQSNPQQNVVVEEESIRIVPAQPQVIYVPEYDPEVVYMSGPVDRPGLLAFSSGFMIGAWLNSDLNWNTHRVYYHGWEGPGWISYSRPYVRVTNRMYVNDSYRSRIWGNRAYRSRPVVVNRRYVTRHENRYEFNRNRGAGVVRGVQRRTPTALERINTMRERGRGNRISPPTGGERGGRMERRTENMTAPITRERGGRVERRTENITAPITRERGGRMERRNENITPPITRERVPRVERRTENITAPITRERRDRVERRTENITPPTTGERVPRVERRTENITPPTTGERGGRMERRREATTDTPTEQKQRQRKNKD
jgi:hypothetical protein